jgi:hypothetical protein
MNDGYRFLNFLNLPLDNDSFYEGIELFDADKIIVTYIVTRFTDYRVIIKEMCGLQASETVKDQIEKRYTKAEGELEKILIADMPEIWKEIIKKDIEKLRFTRSIFTASADRYRYKSVRQMLTYQAYLLFEYLKKARLSQFYDLDDYKLEAKDMEIYTTIAQIFHRVYPGEVFHGDATFVKQLVDNGRKLEQPRLRKLEKTIKIFSRTLPE